jgi:hypothetical protein
MKFALFSHSAYSKWLTPFLVVTKHRVLYNGADYRSRNEQKKFVILYGAGGDAALAPALALEQK